MDSLHGNLDPSNIEKAMKSVDLQLKISEEVEKEMNISYSSAGSAHEYLSDDEIRKIKKMFEELRPFSKERKLVSFAEPLKEANNFQKLEDEPSLVDQFLSRNKSQFSSWGPFV